MGDEKVKNEAMEIMGLFQVLPRLVVFDLDYTLWPFYCECRSKREMPSLYPHAKGILYALKDKGIDVAVASRSPTSDIANTFLDKLGIKSMFVAKEIFSSWTHKTDHFQKIKQRIDVPYNAMLFFDDENRNIEAVSKMGVASVLVRNGVNLGALREGLSKFSQNLASVERNKQKWLKFSQKPGSRMQEPNYHHHHHYSATGTAATVVSGGVASSKRSNKPQLPPLTVPPGHVCFRLLCHASRVGGIIGKSGSIIRQLQQETSAKIRVGDSLPNSDDHRVVVIIGRTSIVKRISFSADSGGDSTGLNDYGHADEVAVTAAQEAVVRVFERVIEVAAESGGDGLAAMAARGGLASCRLLVETSQVGSVIGKGGKVIEKIKKDTGCKIKVLTAEKLPSDEMVEIEGDIVAVKRALVAVTQCLQDCLVALAKSRMMGSRPYEGVPQDNSPDLRTMQRALVLQSSETSSSERSSGDYPLCVEADRVLVTESKPPQQESVFKILCLNDRVGGVIGKGGSIIRELQAETKASISIGPTIAECDERLITITAMENPDSRHSPAQNAAILVFSRCTDTNTEKGLDSGSRGIPVCARLIISSSQVGCLLGKGGAIVSEMRKATGAAIRIFGSEHVPRCASENDEVVQITGEFVNVQNALYHVTSRLRDNLFSSRILNGAGNRSSSSVVTETLPFGRARDQPMPGTFPSVGVSNSHSQHNALMRSMNNLNLSQNVNRPSSPTLWTLETVPGVDQRSLVDGRGLTSTKGGVELGSGNKSAFVTNTTVEIVVPKDVIGSVYGDNGSNLVRLRQISGANVVVHEPRPGTTDRTVVISGSPDETQAAQSLLHAFIIAGSS